MSVQSLGSRGIIGDFYLALEQNPGPGWIEPVSTLIPSDQETETYDWIGQSPQMREWIGGRQARGFNDFEYTIRNKPYEATLQIPTEWLRRDKTGQIAQRIRELAQRANAHWASLLSTQIINGESTACYDGQFFFDTDHSEGDSGSQSNDISVDISALPVAVNGSTTSPSDEEMMLAIFEGIKSIHAFVDDRGEPMNEDANDFVVMVPNGLHVAAAAALGNMRLNNGRDNELLAAGFSLQLAVNVRLTTSGSWTDKFVVFRRTGMPLIRQEEVPISISAVAEDSEHAFKEREHLYGVEAWRNVGYGFWQHACLVTLI